MTEPGSWGTRMVRRHRGVAVYGYRSDPATPPVTVQSMGVAAAAGMAPHIHDFPILVHIGSQNTVYVVAPGALIDTAAHVVPDDAIVIFFDPSAVHGAGQWPTWQRHPLLFPFLHGRSGGMLRVDLPDAHRTTWEYATAAIEAESAACRDGYREAVLAHLTVLLIDLARLTADVVTALRDLGEPLLAEVFAVIDQRYGDRLSLRDVARAVGITPGHLTTVVRRRTGRTVQEWITERRMAQARELLSTTDLPISVIAHRVGLNDARYFARVFRRHHDRPPRAWRTHTRRT